MEIIDSLKGKNTTVKLYSKTVTYKMICVIISFLNTILISRSLGVELRGEYTTIINWASMLQLFLNLGIGTTYPTFKRKYPDTSKEIFVTFTYIIATIYMLISIVFLIFFKSINKYIIILTYITTVENLLIFIAIVEDVSKRNIINIVTSIVHFIILILIYFFNSKNLDLVICAVIFDHMILSISFIILYKMNRFNFKLIKFNMIIEILKCALPAMFMNLLMYLNYHADVLFLSYLGKNNIEVGLYGTAVGLGNMLWIIPDAFKDIIYNRASKKDNPKEILTAIICNMIICIFVILGFAIFGKLFLRCLYGSEFENAYTLVLLLFIGTLPMVLYKLIHPLYIANGKTIVVVALLMVAVVANIIGNIILIPRYLGKGAAISSVISYLICGVAFFLKFKNDYKLNFKKLYKIKK